MSKACKRCGIEKPIFEFAHSRGKPRSQCKPCWSRTNIEATQRNPEAYRKRSAEWRAKRGVQMLMPPLPDWIKKERADQRRRDWMLNNPEAMNEARKNWNKSNKHSMMESVKRRQANQRNATPCWANRKKMQAIYAEAQRLIEQTGVPHDVDHIVPLTSKYVCGLHCEANLQVLPRFKNRSKSNKTWPDMPMEFAV